MTNINTSHAVYVLGDVDTSQRVDMLQVTAAQHNAVIGQTFAFAPGEASGSDDLSRVDAVVEALGRAIATHTDVWLPFWLQDFFREQHLRSLSMTLQRHGLNLLLGPDLIAYPVAGGLNEMDAALRNEIRAVFALDDAAVAAAGVQALAAEIEADLARAADAMVIEPPADESESPVERRYSTAEAAALLGKSADWVSRGLRQRAFVYADGSAVEPMRPGGGGRRVFTAAMVRAIAWSAYRRGTLSPQHLEAVSAALRGHGEVHR